MTVVLPATLEDVERAVSVYFSLDADALRGSRRGRQSITTARAVFYYMARQRTRTGVRDAADHLGFTHAAASEAVTRLSRRIRSDETLRSDVEAIGRILDGEPVQAAGVGHILSDYEARHAS